MYFKKMISQSDGSESRANMLIRSFFKDWCLDGAFKLKGFCAGDRHFHMQRMKKSNILLGVYGCQLAHRTIKARRFIASGLSGDARSKIKR